MRRYLSAALVSVALLAACNGEEIPEPSPTPPATPTPTPEPTGAEVEIELEAEDFDFDQTELTVAAGAIVQMELKNRDGGIPHNFGLYASQGGAMIFQSENVTGRADVEFTFTAPSEPGTYHFQCDVHPQQMTGTFTVT